LKGKLLRSQTLKLLSRFNKVRLLGLLIYN